MTTHLRTLSFTALLNQEVGYFDREENRTGILVSRIATDAARVNVLIGTVLGTLVQLAVNILGGLVVGLVVSWKVTVVTMGCIPLLIFAGMYKMTVFIFPLTCCVIRSLMYPHRNDANDLPQRLWRKN